ncbi:sensor histidine kinase [Aquisphaera insulae]|uniref:sensor histidine kinase n=1 Tax=Aquisphaera insulae TaxID=2712864 RepID=UPI0013EBE062|nr:PAS domain-containing sensor histidine kinase [Aquisphaera insulae]
MIPPPDAYTHGAEIPSARETSAGPIPVGGIPAWLPALLATLSEAVVITDEAGDVILLNRAATELSGWARHEAIGHPIAEILEVHGHAPEPGKSCGLEHCDQCRPFSPSPTERVLIRRGGHRLKVEATCTPVADDRGVVSARVIVLRDLSERVQRLEEIGQLNLQLTRRVRQLQTVLDTAPVGILVAEDSECLSVTCNRAMAEMLGIEPGEDVVRAYERAEVPPFRIFRHGIEVDPPGAPLLRAAREEGDVLGEIYQVVRADGSCLSTLLNAMPVRDEAGTPQGVVGVVVDITALQEAKDALALANRRKDEFLAMLGHELRNPLGAIASAAGLLRASLDPADREWATDVLDRQTNHLTRLVDDLLDASRLTLGKVSLQRTEVDVVECVMKAAQAVRPLVEERGQTLEVIAPPRPSPVFADPVRLEQVIVNLLSNASKFTPERGKIRLHGGAVGRDIVISIRDNGVGIPPDRIDAMFELFAQGERTLARSDGGLGIGLTLAKTLIEMHGGGLDARSDGPGQGSEFTVRLPGLDRTEF